LIGCLLLSQWLNIYRFWVRIRFLSNTVFGWS